MRLPLLGKRSRNRGKKVEASIFPLKVHGRYISVRSILYILVCKLILKNKN